MSGTVLVVEDDREIRELLRRYLERAGFAVHTTASGAEAVRLLDGAGLDLVVLDLGLPDIDGLEVLAAARRDDVPHEEGRTGPRRGVPVVLLTARTGVDDRIRGLRHGADDYVTKPFSPTELVLRVQAILDRTGRGAVEPDSRCYGGGQLCIDEVHHEVRLAGRPLDLTPTEWGLLTTMAAAPGRVFSRYELVNRVRGYEFAGYERTIDSHIKNLRHKLGDGADLIIQTVLGVGYRMALHRDRPAAELGTGR